MQYTHCSNHPTRESFAMGQPVLFCLSCLAPTRFNTGRRYWCAARRFISLSFFCRVFTLKLSDRQDIGLVLILFQKFSLQYFITILLITKVSSCQMQSSVQGSSEYLASIYKTLNAWRHYKCIYITTLNSVSLTLSTILTKIY